MNQNLFLQIKYNKLLPIFLLFCSIFVLYVSLLVGISLNTITAIILLIVSLLMLLNPIVEITPSEIRMKNIIGKTVKTHLYTPDSIAFKNNNVYVDGKKILNTWWMDTDVNKIRAFVESNI